MKIVALDDEVLMLESIKRIANEIEFVDEITTFNFEEDLLEYLKENTPDAILLDINMPGKTGLDIASELKELYRDIPIIFTTGYDEYAVEAFHLKASGYLLKPVRKEKLEEELQYILNNNTKKPDKKIKIITLGNFDVYYNNKRVNFKRSKSKEILAYLVTKKGTSVSRAEISSILWEERLYDRSLQTQLNTIIFSLKKDLEENQISQILDDNNAMLSVNTDTFYCDYYEILNENEDEIKNYTGQFLSQYSWAEYITGYLENIVNSRRDTYFTI